MKKKKFIKMMVISLGIIAIVGGVYLGNTNSNSLVIKGKLSDIAEKIENTYLAEGYTVLTPNGNEYDVIYEGETFYAALVDDEEGENYKRYTFLMEGANVIDHSLYSYDNGEDSDNVKYLEKEYNEIKYFSNPYVSRFLRLPVDMDEDYRPDNGIHYNGLKSLVAAYDENDEIFDFVKKIEFTNDSMEIFLYTGDYIEWCSENVKDFGSGKNDLSADETMRYLITFEGDYVRKIIVAHSGGGASNLDLNIWEFNNVGEKSEDLVDYVEDSEAYFKNLLIDINGKLLNV